MTDTATHASAMTDTATHASAMTDTATEETVETDEQTDHDRPWNVIVWNDPINLMSYVTFVFRKVFGYSEAKAEKLMLDVHHKGRALVSQGTRTEAERDLHQLHAHGLWATMEKVDQ